MLGKLKKFDRQSVFDHMSLLAKKVFQRSRYEIVMVCIIVDELKKETSFLSTTKEDAPFYLMSSLLRVMPDDWSDEKIAQQIIECRKTSPNIKDTLTNEVEEIMECDPNKMN